MGQGRQCLGLDARLRSSSRAYRRVGVLGQRGQELSCRSGIRGRVFPHVSNRVRRELRQTFGRDRRIGRQGGTHDLGVVGGRERARCLVHARVRRGRGADRLRAVVDQTMDDRGRECGMRGCSTTRVPDAVVEDLLQLLARRVGGEGTDELRHLGADRIPAFLGVLVEWRARFTEAGDDRRRGSLGRAGDLRGEVRLAVDGHDLRGSVVPGPEEGHQPR